MQHIQETAAVFPFLYYQRIFVKGYVVLGIPAVFAVTSDIAKGYIYLRRRTQGLRIRDLSNAFIRDASGGQPIGLRDKPDRDLAKSISADVMARGRDAPLTWLYTKDDLPRIINEETFTEFLACVPVRHAQEPPVGDFSLVSTYFSNFIDWYRFITGDLSITGPQHWNSHIPMHSECLVDIRQTSGQLIDEVVLQVDPPHFAPRMFHIDLEPNETATANPLSDGVMHEQRIANFLAEGKKVPIVHRRLADILHLTQETKDWGLVALSMFPVFEQYLDGYFEQVCARNSAFKNFMTKERRGRKIIYIGERVKWIPVSLTHLGFDAAAAQSFYEQTVWANEERVRVVHYNKQPTFEEAMNLARVVTNAILMFETALGQETAYAVRLVKRRDGTPG